MARRTVVRRRYYREHGYGRDPVEVDVDIVTWLMSGPRRYTTDAFHGFTEMGNPYVVAVVVHPDGTYHEASLDQLRRVVVDGA